MWMCQGAFVNGGYLCVEETAVAVEVMHMSGFCLL